MFLLIGTMPTFWATRMFILHNDNVSILGELWPRAHFFRRRSLRQRLRRRTNSKIPTRPLSQQIRCKEALLQFHLMKINDAVVPPTIDFSLKLQTVMMQLCSLYCWKHRNSASILHQVACMIWNLGHISFGTVLLTSRPVNACDPKPFGVAILF